MVFRGVSSDHGQRDVVHLRLLKKIMLRASMLPLNFSAMVYYHFFVCLFFSSLGSNIPGFGGIKISPFSEKNGPILGFLLPFFIIFIFWGGSCIKKRSLYTAN